MNCSIKNTLASKVIQTSSRPVEPGYFDTDKFIKQFGEWRAGPLSEAQIAENVLDKARFNEDGSPRVDVNKYGITFFIDKKGVRTPIIGEEFSTLPLDIRSEVSEEIMNAVVADLLLDHLVDNEDFLAGKRVEDFNLDAYFEERTNSYWDLGMTDQALISTRESKQDYLDGINAKLRNLGVKIETDAIKQAQSIERPTTDKASPTIKALMQFVPRVDSSGERIDSVNIPGNPTFMKPSEVWGATLAHMADIPMQKDKNMVDVYMAKLQELTITHPWAMEIYEELEEGSDTLRLQFVSAMNNVKNNVNITEYKNGTFATKNAVASSTSRNKVTSEWTTILVNTVDSLSKEQVDNIVLDVIPDAQEAIENIPVPTEETVAEALLELHEALAPVFQSVNIGIDENLTMAAFNEQVKRLYNGKDEEVNYIEAYKSFSTLLSDSWLPVIGTAISDPTSYNLTQFGNAMITFSQGQVNVEDDSGVHMVTVGKNRIYVYSLPSVLQETINEWKSNPAMVQELIEDPTVANSLFLQHFANPNNLAQLKVGMRGVITTTSSTGRADSKDGGDISKGDYAKVDFYNVLRMLGDDNKHVPIYNTQVPADKGKEFQFEAAGLFRETESSEQAADIFAGYVRDEFNQMRAAERYISNEIDREVYALPQGMLKSMFEELTTANPEISSAAKLSLIVQSIDTLDGPTRVDLKELVEEVKKTMTVNFHLKKDTLIDMTSGSETLGKFVGGAFNYTTAESINNVDGLKHPVSGLPLPQTDLVLIEDKAMSSEIKDKLTKAIRNKIDKFKEEAGAKYGIYYGLDGSYGIDRNVVQYYQSKYKDIADPIAQTSAIEDALMRDFVVNYMISKIEYSKLFTGDLSFYKGVSDYIKRVPATYVDGLQPVTGLVEGDTEFTQMTFATEELNDMELSYDPNLATEVRAHYAEVDRTDAQGYIRPSRWKQLVTSIGKMGSEAQQVYDKIVKQGEYVENNQDIPTEYLLTPKEIKVLSAQPLKGVYFKNEIGGVPTYLKYSQAVLLPQFVANNPKARTLLAYMEEHGIDEMVAQTGVKVGATRPTPLFDTEGNFIAPKNPVVNTLDARNWRLQQDLPTKTIKDNKIGVQVQKIIMSGLAFSGDTTLLQEIENALGDLSNIGLDQFYSKYGISIEANGSAKITDIPVFYASLIKDIQAKEVPENNTLRALKAETPISLLPMLKDSLQSQIFSSIRKATTNLMTPGGAYIQISDQLIGKTEIERRGITMLVDSLDRLKPPMVTEYTASDGSVHKSVRPGQVLIPHAMIASYIPDYQSMSPAELRAAIPKELREIIGYRIPTQAKASVDLLEVVGILPIELGDSIITYGEITAKTGSDFDIDKMFFMMHEMIKLNEGIVKAKDGIKGARNRVIDLFKKVLKDPKYYNEMMTSIDNDTFKEGTTSLLETREAEDMDAWDPVRAIDTRFAYRTGGTGVAVSANSLSDHVLTQNKELKMVFNQGKWGNELMDAQFSEDLTKKELNKVLSVINAKRDEKGQAQMGIDEAETRLRRVSISGTLSELTNAFVDIANEDAFVTRGNWGTLTNGYGMMMIRQGIHPHKVSAMLRQPALVQLIEAITNREGLVDNTPAHEIEEEIFSEWKIKAQDAGLDIKFATVPTFGKLDKIDFDALFDSAVNQNANTHAELKNQLLVLKSYIQSKPAVKKYNAFVTTTKNDAKGAGRNAEDMFLRQNKLSDAYYYELPGKGQVGYGLQKAHQKFFDGKGNNTLSYTMHVNTVGVAQKIIDDNPLMFDSINSEVFELFNRAAAQNTSDKRVNNLAQAQFLFREYAAYKMSGFGPISTRDSVEQVEDFVNDIMDLKSTRKYELLNKLLIDYDANTSEYTLKMERLSQKSPESKNSLTNSWRQILQEEPALGDFLVRQAYRQSSFLPGPNQFHELIPFEWFMEKDYLDFLHSTQPLPGDLFLEQAVRKENATEFFKYIKSGLFENYYISNITEDVNRMGTYGKGNNAMGKAPKFAVTGEYNTPVKLLGTITTVEKGKDGKLERKSFAVYNPLNESKDTEASYDVSHGNFMAQVDPKGEEYARELAWKDTILKGYETAIKQGVRVSIKDIGSLGIKFEGESFFTEPGNMVNLETEKGLYEARQSDLPSPEQMCG